MDHPSPARQPGLTAVEAVPGMGERANRRKIYSPAFRERFRNPPNRWAAERATYPPTSCAPLIRSHLVSVHPARTCIRCEGQIPCVSRRSSNGAFSPTTPANPSCRHHEHTTVIHHSLTIDLHVLNTHSKTWAVIPNVVDPSNCPKIGQSIYDRTRPIVSKPIGPYLMRHFLTSREAFSGKDVPQTGAFLTHTREHVRVRPLS